MADTSSVTLVEALDDTLGETPVGQPIDISDDTPSETAPEKPSGIPYDTPGDKSTDTQGDKVLEKPGDKPVDKPCNKAPDKKVKMNQFDKFKRRLIRTVARMLITEKVEESEMWKTMNKETGRDCKTIWQHMRALTLRKLSRLLAADDYVTRVGEVARMSPVDWLQFDLVLVHEDIDVWDLGTANNKSLTKLSAPWDLLQLVHQHDVIHTCGEQLALTWATITVHYNRKGRQCSPMLLQKRWHQLLQRTRDRFYVYWYEYRGVDSKIVQAKEFAPTTLEYTIAKCYPIIVTKQFPKWSDAMLGGNHRIVLVNELQQVMRDKQREKLIEEGPELVLMEPKIDTIEIGDESEEEKADDEANKIGTVAPNEANTTTANENAALPKIKEEPPEHIENLDPEEPENGLSNVKIVNAAHVTTAEIVDNDVAQLDLIDKTEHEIVLDDTTNDNIDLLSPDNTGDKVDLESNSSELVTKSLELAVTGNIIPTDLNTNQTVVDSSNEGVIRKEPIITKELDIPVSFQAQSLISPELVTENQLPTREIDMGDQETTTNTSDNMAADLNTSKTGSNLPEADNFKQEPEFAEETNIAASIKDEPLVETIETSDDNCYTNNICITETRSLNHENLNDTPCPKVQDMMVKIEHTLHTGIEDHTSLKVNLLSEEILSEKIEENVAISTVTDDTLTTNNTENNDAIIKDQDFIYTRTLTDTVAIANQCPQALDIEEDIIMYDPALSVNNDNSLEGILPTDDVNIAVIADDCEPMEIVDDGIDDGEYLVEDECGTHSALKPLDSSGNSDNPAKIDLKLIMNAIVFTTKLENMNSLKNRSIEEVKSDALINEVLRESKPVKFQTQVEAILNLDYNATGKNLNIDISNENQNNATNEHLNIDASGEIWSHEFSTKDVSKAIYSNKINDDNIEIKMEVEDENAENNTMNYSELHDCQEDQESSEDEYENIRINPNSKMFKKPNNLSYNPVQLCKNPDFNTRLKRIPILFYTYQSNKEYLKECKPLTIDLDKGFERKMYNNTIYLKRDPNAVRVKVAPKIQNIVSETDNNEEGNKKIDNPLTVVQDQSNEVQVKLETIFDISNEELLSERKRKHINLHDIVKVRRINQQLLTAEISPIINNDLDNSNTCETIDLTSKLDALPVNDMNIVKEEPTNTQKQQQVLIPENPIETNATALNQQPITQPPKPSKHRVVSKQHKTPWYLKKTPHARPIERQPIPSNETLENRVRRIYGDSLLTDDAVNKMLSILETDALEDAYVKKFFSCRAQVKPPTEKKMKIRKRKLSSELVEQNINGDVLISDNIDEDKEQPMQAEEEKRNCQIETKRKRTERQTERRRKMQNEKLYSIEKKIYKTNLENIKKVENDIVPKVNIVCRYNKASLLTYDEHKKAKEMLTTRKKIASEVKCIMLCRTVVQCQSTPVYSFRRTFDTGPKMTVFADHGLFKKGTKFGGMSFLVPANVEKKLTMSPIVLRNFEHNESMILPKQSEIKPSPLPLSRDSVRLNIKPKDIVLSAKFLSMFPENSSFGKDKIILTTANLECFAKLDEPSPVKATPAPIVHSGSQQLFPPFAVPEGVRFYLTATGDVVSTVDANITDPDVTTSIPLYVNAIKDMLVSAQSNIEAPADPISTAIVIPQCETTDNSLATESVATTTDITQSNTDDYLKTADTLTNPELSQLATETSKPKAVTASIATSSESNQCLNVDELKETQSNFPALTKDINLMDINTTLTTTTEERSNKVQETSNSDSLCDSTIGDIEKNKADLVATSHNDHESISGPKKSILSDLMAMTGITSEDIMTSKTEEPEIPEATEIPVTSIVPITPLVELPLADYVTDLTSEDTNPNLKNLTPVTSFEMLKYANTQNGEFYKLDLITGIILPITVGFKRVKTYAKRNNIRTVQMHSTIDLTDDGDDGGFLESNNASIEGSRTKTSVIRDVRRASLTDDEMPDHIYKPQPRSRKQKLQPRSYEATHTDGVVNLSEFDEAVDEEHLDDSSESEMEEPEGDETEDDDDTVEQLSSDEDEPLSTVISRRNSKNKNAFGVVAASRDSQSSIDKSETDAQLLARETNVLNLGNNEDIVADLEFDAALRAAMNPVDESTNDSDALMDDSGGDSDEDFILGF